MTERDKRSCKGDSASRGSSRDPKAPTRRTKAPSTSTLPKSPPTAALSSEKKNIKQDARVPEKSAREDIPVAQPAVSQQQQPGNASSTRENAVQNPPLRSVQEAPENRRVEDLENALAAAQAQQRQMSLELDRLRQHKRAPSQTSIMPSIFRSAVSTMPLPSLSGSHSGAELGITDLMAEAHRHCSMMEDRLVFQKQIVQLRDRLYEQQAVVGEYGREKVRWDEQRDVLLADLHAVRSEVNERTEQLRNLKKSVAELTRVENEVSDAELKDEMEALYHQSREWVVSSFRRATLELEHLPEDIKVLRDQVVPHHQSLPGGAKLGVFQAILTHYQLQIFEERGLFGLPGPPNGLGHVKEALKFLERRIKGYDPVRVAVMAALQNHWEDLENANLTKDADRWRKPDDDGSGIENNTNHAKSADLCSHAVAEGNQTENQKINQDSPTWEIQTEQPSLETLVNQVVRALGYIAKSNPTESSKRKLEEVLGKAISIARILALQRSRYSVEIPTSSRFDPDLMENVNPDEEGESAAKGSLCLSPALLKGGDDVEESTLVVIAKAKAIRT